MTSNNRSHSPTITLALALLATLAPAAALRADAIPMQSVLLEQHPLSAGVASQGLALSTDYYYGATATALFQFDTNWNFIQSRPISVPGADHMGAIHYATADNHIWAGFLDSTGSGTCVVARIDPLTLTVVQSWDITGPVGWIDPVFFDGTHVWVGDMSSLGIHRFRLEAGQLVHDGVLRYPSSLSFSQGIRIRGNRLYSIHTFGSADGLFQFDLPAEITDTFVEPARVWPIQETLMHLEGFDFIPGTTDQIWHAQSSQVDRYQLLDIEQDPTEPPNIPLPCPDADQLVIVHDWFDLANTGTNGSLNDAVLVNNGIDPIVAAGAATVFNGGTPGPGVPYGDDDGFISFGTVPQFQGATYFELTWTQLDLDETAGTSHVLCGALAPGFAAGSQTVITAAGVGTGLAAISVRLYESGGAFGGSDPNEIVADVVLDNVLPATPVDLKLVYAGNGFHQTQGGAGLVSAFIDGLLVAQESINIGVLNPDEPGASFGIGKYHDASTVAGAYTTGTFTVAFAPLPDPDTLPADFFACLAGPAADLGPGCHCLDHDTDGDVDLQDLAVLQRSFPQN